MDLKIVNLIVTFASAAVGFLLIGCYTEEWFILRVIEILLSSKYFFIAQK